MKLEGIQNGRLVLSEHRQVYEEDETGEFRQLGRLPDPTSGLASIPFRLQTTRFGRLLLRLFTGTIHNVNVWRLTEDEFLANAGRWLFYSDDTASTWRLSLTLSASSGVRGLLPSAVASHDGHVYVGEYPTSYDETPRIYRTDDPGGTWETVLSLPDSRHIHAVQSDPYTDRLWVATGDTDNESMIGFLEDDKFHVVGTGSQRWRAVSLVFTPEAVLWGMDCLYERENRLLRLEREDLSAPPETVHVIEDPVYYATSMETTEETLAFFSTGSCSGTDDTAPDDVDQERRTRPVEVWMAGSRNGFATWTRVDSFRRRRNIFDRIGYAGLSANSYAFLVADPERGLFVTPYNTTTDDSVVKRYDRRALERRLETSRP